LSTAENTNELRDEIINVIKQIFDPEIPVNIWELGLIYDLAIEADGQVDIKMTLTSPTCPVAESLPLDVESKVRALESVKSVKLEMVWDPPWDMDRLSEAAKLTLNL
jgi:FeS assembly SUF system protein